MKKLICIILLLYAVLVLCACGEKPKPEPTPTPAPEPTALPAPEPTIEPELPSGMPVTVDGTRLESGSVMYENALYVRADELSSALGLKFGEKDGAALIDGTETGKILSYRDKEWVDIDLAAERLLISRYEDSELQRLYYTPGAGNWVLEEGCRVPVLMYHAVSDNVWGYDGLFVSPAAMEEQLIYLTENGYTPIFFEDLKNISEIEKPVLLTFDDGYKDNYTELFPLLKKYNVKATVFLITYWIGGEVYLNTDEIAEMSASGLVSFQSHSASHPDMSQISRDEQSAQMWSSKVTITRITGKEPFVFCYPSGKHNADTLELVGQYYRFATAMAGEIYVTGANAAVIGRKYISRDMGIKGFASMLE